MKVFTFTTVMNKTKDTSVPSAARGFGVQDKECRILFITVKLAIKILIFYGYCYFYDNG